jgi:cytochrome bd-type quinol oxidase subunit 2
MANWGAAPPPYRPVPPYQQWPGRAPRRVTPGVLFGVTMWRLLIVLFAIIGFSLAVQDAEGSDALAALSQQASLLTAICYGFLLLFPVFTGGRRHEPDSPWLRGALTVLLSLVSITFLTMLGGDFSQPWSLFEHLLTPSVVALDWLFVGRDQRNARWWYPLSWLAFPLAYLLFYIAYVGSGEPLYPFLDPGASDFLGVVFEFLGGVLVFGFVVYGFGKLHGRGRP